MECHSWRQYFKKGEWNKKKKRWDPSRATVVNNPTERPMRAIVLDIIGYESDVVPTYIAKLFHVAHLGNDDRFCLTKFLWGNGVSPQLIRSFYKEWYRSSKPFKEDAPGQIEDMLKRLAKKEIKGRGQWYFDLATGCDRSVLDGRLKPRLSGVDKPRHVEAYRSQLAEREDWLCVQKGKPPREEAGSWAPRWTMRWKDWEDDKKGWVRERTRPRKK